MRQPELCRSDRNVLLQIERNAVTPFNPGEVTHLLDRGLVERTTDGWKLTEAGRLAINGTVAMEWRTLLSA